MGTVHVQNVVTRSAVVAAAGEKVFIAPKETFSFQIVPGASGTLQALITLDGADAANGVNAEFTATNATNLLTSVMHGLVDGRSLEVSNSGGALPGGLSASTMYWVVNATADTFQLSATPGGSAIALSNDGTGTQTWTLTATWTALEAAQSAAKTYLLNYPIVAIKAIAATANGQVFLARK